MDNQTARHIFDLFLRFNRLLGFARVRHATRLHINESQILSSLLDEGRVVASRLTSDLLVDKSTVSRAIDALNRKGYLNWRPSRSDKRAKVLAITAKGRAILLEDKKIWARQISECIAPLDAKEQSDLAFYLRGMATAMHASPMSALPDEHPVSVEVMRLTRVFGFLGENYLNTEMPVEKNQILFLVAKHGPQMPLMRLREMVHFESSVFSRIVSRLSAGNAIKKDNAKKDRRMINVSLTDSGRNRLEKAINQASHVIDQAHSLITPAELPELIRILEKYLPEHIIPAPIMAEARLSVELIMTDDARQFARGFMIEHLVRRNMHYKLGENIISHGSIVYGLYCDKLLSGVVELHRGAKDWEITNFVVTPEVQEQQLTRKFLCEAVRDLMGRYRVKVLITANPMVLSEVGRIRPNLDTEQALKLSAKMIAELSLAL